ncbi:MAG: hypothetical protein ACWA42_03030 [Lutibacter sp.]
MKASEFIGKITKQENISTINENKLPNTFVIHVPDPYKSYYTRFTHINKPSSVIFVTKTPNSFEKALRVTSQINTIHHLNLEAAKCEVMIGKRKINGIRIHGIKRFTDIPAIQQYFKDADYQFAKSEKLDEVEALIRINRFLNLAELDKGIYHSTTEDDTYFVEIPEYLKWEDFKRITYEIKNNISDKNYDIAQGIIYKDGGITDILRIVKPKISVDMLKTIQEKYLKKLQ